MAGEWFEIGWITCPYIGPWIVWATRPYDQVRLTAHRSYSHRWLWQRALQALRSLQFFTCYPVFIYLSDSKWRA